VQSSSSSFSFSFFFSSFFSLFFQLSPFFLFIYFSKIICQFYFLILSWLKILSCNFFTFKYYGLLRCFPTWFFYFIFLLSNKLKDVRNSLFTHAFLFFFFFYFFVFFHLSFLTFSFFFQLSLFFFFLSFICFSKIIFVDFNFLILS
jgi:hypothetical protein